MDTGDDTAWMWTDDCYMLEDFETAWSIWYGEDEDWLLNMKKAHQKWQPRIKAMKKAMKAKISPKESLKKSMIATVTKQSTKKPNTMVSWPGDHCYTWDMDAECEAEWDAAWASCDEYWTRDCDELVDAWFSSDIDFQYPTRPADECFYDGAEWGTDACFAAWEQVWDQCMNEPDTPWEDIPYYWTEECEIIWMFSE